METIIYFYSEQTIGVRSLNLETMKSPQIIYAFIISLTLSACSNQNDETTQSKTKELKPLVDQFADLRVIRYDIPGFENLTLKEKKFVYYLNQAGLAGGRGVQEL